MNRPSDLKQSTIRDSGQCRARVSHVSIESTGVSLTAIFSELQSSGVEATSGRQRANISAVISRWIMLVPGACWTKLSACEVWRSIPPSLGLEFTLSPGCSSSSGRLFIAILCMVRDFQASSLHVRQNEYGSVDSGRQDGKQMREIFCEDLCRDFGDDQESRVLIRRCTEDACFHVEVGPRPPTGTV
ncbi:hypothetical protein C8R44DRAFT_735292 [Mycena epipterygia]|nr:hypothetical protein C8R44DRAFT_735292 [Mycena epipterygia]